ncbi:MAG: DUF4402 domain-containing protein [Bacteroidota bacterium]
METLTKFFLFLVALCGLSFASFSQIIEEASANVSASIVEPVSISKTVNSDFGNVAIIFAGRVEMAPAGSLSRAGNIILPISTGTFTAATFNFAGTAGYSYSVSFPTSPVIIENGTNSMKVTSFTSDLVVGSGTNLIAGVYVSVTPSNVMVNYN